MSTELRLSEIPIIDFSATSSTDSHARAKLAAQVRAASLDVGFFYAKNHGVSQAVVDKAFGRAKEFFRLPLEEKMKMDISKSSNFKGYTAVLGENVNPENRGDLHEGFDISSEGDNVWPQGLDGFKDDVSDYWNEILALGQRMFPIFAQALDLPENYFNDKVDRSSSTMRLLYYPPQEGAVDDRVQGIGAHTDYECFTILCQDDVEALQVLNKDGKWMNATPVPGTFVVNIADQLARWTNDTFVSTTHRAINRTGKERYSIPFFFGSNADCIVEPLPSCVSASRPAKYPPILAGEYVRGRLQETYEKHHDTKAISSTT